MNFIRYNQGREYMDYAATTPVDRRVVEAMTPYFSQIFGNPSSVHFVGQQAEAALEDARESVARALNCLPSEVIFTSGGSESDNLALRGAAFAARKQRQANRILISPVEHHAVSRTAEQLANLHGFELEFLPVDEFGMVAPGDVENRLEADVALVSVIYANNEIGTINPIAEIGAVCRRYSVPFHTDAVQGAAHFSADVQTLQVDMMSIGAHKFYGPKGVGALFCRAGTPLIPIQTGGSQEHGLRAGTHNIPLIIGLAKALEIAQSEREQRAEKYIPWRDHLIGQLLEEVPDARLTGHPVQRLPNHASFAFHGVDGNTLLMMLDQAGFACSSGSACKTGDPEPSDVLIALGLPPDWALGSLRITLGSETRLEAIDSIIQTLPGMIEQNRSYSRKESL